MSTVVISDPEKLKKNAKRMLKTIQERGGTSSLSAVQAGFAACYGYPDWNALLGAVGSGEDVSASAVKMEATPFIVGIDALATEVRSIIEQELEECLGTRFWFAVAPNRKDECLEASDANVLNDAIGELSDALNPYTDEFGNPRESLMPVGGKAVGSNMIIEIQSALETLTLLAIDKGPTFGDFNLDDFISAHQSLKDLFGLYGEDAHVCDNCCYFTMNESDLGTIQRLFSRVEPGDTMPTGECPMCGCLVFPHDDAS